MLFVPYATVLDYGARRLRHSVDTLAPRRLAVNPMSPAPGETPSFPSDPFSLAVALTAASTSIIPVKHPDKTLAPSSRKVFCNRVRE